MSEYENKDNNNFEFIKEQVIEKKRKKLKKHLMPLIMTIFLAILFGLIAAVTFVVAEPELYKLLNNQGRTKTPVSYPTATPADQGTDTNDNSEAEASEINDNETDVTGTENTGTDNTGTDNTEIVSTSTGEGDNPTGETTETEPLPTPIIQKIDATLDDYLIMYNEIHNVVYEVDKSLVTVTSTFPVIDYVFGTPDKKTVTTTGVIVANNSKDFLILVSLDRVQDAESIKIKFSDTLYADAVIQDYETEVNIALLAVAIQDIPTEYLNSLKVAKLGESFSIAVGNPVIAMGNPNGYIDSMDIGIVTSKGSYANITDNRMDLFNSNMEFNASSDGIVINFKGEIIGWITRTLNDGKNKSINTVIGISKLAPIIRQMINQDPRTYFGIIADDMTSDAKLAHDTSIGIYISEVKDDSPAYAAGLKSGDIILYINDKIIINTNSFYNAIASYEAGVKVTVTIQRTTGSTQKVMYPTVVLSEKVQ